MQRLLGAEGALALGALIGDAGLRAAIRAEVALVRDALVTGAVELDRDALALRIDRALAGRAERAGRRHLRSVINATGVVLHTNLGRAPLGADVLDEVVDACRGYAALEYDLDEGERGHRDRVVKSLLVSLTGAEDAMVVNNCAAAVLLACTALASGREVIVSRGELVEIGGGFRIPDVIASCGATLVEVGTTNKTRAQDFERAITERTGAMLTVHQSNFAVVGFTQRASRDELAKLARARSIPLLEDLGSGALVDLASFGVGHEPTVQEAVSGGSDVVMFSGDKLLGGPQAGIIVGRAAWIERLRRHSLVRALRPGRIVMAALESTLVRYARGRATDELPALRALVEPLSVVEARAARLEEAARAHGFDLRDSVGAPNVRGAIEPSIARVGGGTLPLVELPSRALVLRADDSDGGQRSIRGIERSIRTQSEPPIVARVSDGALWLDARTIADREVDAVGRGLARALAESHASHRSDLREARPQPTLDPDEP
jgi:L-seryl-tRNA(Ser) seleniumtransferase